MLFFSWRLRTPPFRGRPAGITSCSDEETVSVCSSSVTLHEKAVHRRAVYSGFSVSSLMAMGDRSLFSARPWPRKAILFGLIEPSDEPTAGRCLRGAGGDWAR